MKTYQAIAMGFALLAATTAQAQDAASATNPETSAARILRYERLDLDKIENTYLKCLNSDNQGVVESTIEVVTYMRIAFPDRKMTEIREKVFDLTSSGSSHSVRTKAFVAMQVFANPLAYRKSLDSDRPGSEWSFDNLASKFRP